MYTAPAPTFGYTFPFWNPTILPYSPLFGKGTVTIGQQQGQALLLQNMTGGIAYLRFGQPPTDQYFDFILAGGECKIIEPSDPFLQSAAATGNIIGYAGGPLRMAFGNLVVTVGAPAQ